MGHNGTGKGRTPSPYVVPGSRNRREKQVLLVFDEAGQVERDIRIRQRVRHECCVAFTCFARSVKQGYKPWDAAGLAFSSYRWTTGKKNNITGEHTHQVAWVGLKSIASRLYTNRVMLRRVMTILDMLTDKLSTLKRAKRQNARGAQVQTGACSAYRKRNIGLCGRAKQIAVRLFSRCLHRTKKTELVHLNGR